MILFIWRPNFRLEVSNFGVLAASILNIIDTKYVAAAGRAILEIIADNPAIAPEHAAAFFAEIARTDSARVSGVFGELPVAARAAAILAAMVKNEQAVQAGAIFAEMVENNKVAEAAKIFAAMTNPEQAAAIFMEISETAKVEILNKMIADGNNEQAAAILVEIAGIAGESASLHLFNLLQDPAPTAIGDAVNNFSP